MSTIIGTVKVITVRFLESEVYEGSLPRAAYDEATTEYFECDDLDEAVRMIEREGLSFAATGNEWAAQPDGPCIMNYNTGEHHEISAHLEGFSDADTIALIERVG